MLTISLLVISFGIGLVIYLKGSNLEIWRIEYEYAADDFSQLDKRIQTDTVFQFEAVFCRNFTTSISDTLIEQGIRRHELKVYLPQPGKSKATQLSRDLVESDNVRTITIRYQETERDKRMILYWILFGFFLGIVAEFVLALTKKPSTNNNHQ